MKSTVLSPEPFSVPLSSAPAFARLTDQPRSARARFDRVFEAQVKYLRSLRKSKDDRASALQAVTEQLVRELPRLGEHLRKHPVLAVALGMGGGAIAALLHALPDKPTSGPLARWWEGLEQALEKWKSSPSVERAESRVESIVELVKEKIERLPNLRAAVGDEAS